MKKIISTSLLIIACLVASSTAIARSTINVPMTDPVYRDLDRILGAGLVKDFIYGQRPYSREEVVRLLTEAQKNITEKKDTSPVYDSSVEFFLDLEEVINKRLEEYRSLDEKKKNKYLYFVPLASASLDLTLLDSPARSIPPNNGVGIINAMINPLIQYQGGRHYVEGGTLGLETQHWAQLSPYFSVFAHPRFALLAPTTGSTNGEVIVQELYGKAGTGNFEVEIGRDSLVWGQSPQGSFLLSTNARPLDLIKISNPHPFKFPWLFKHLGNFKGTFFIANLGPEHVFKNDFLSGIRLSLQPHSLVELSVSSLANFGGQGAPQFSFVDGVRDFFGFLPFADISVSTPISNRIATLDGRFTVPPLHNLQVYLEMGIDDKSDENFRSLFVDGNGYLVGFYLPRVTKSGVFDLRLELKRISELFYRHIPFQDGYTLNGLLFGDALGPDAWSIGFASNFFLTPDSTLTVGMTGEFRDSNTYVRIGAENHILVDSVREERIRSMVSWHQEWSKHWESLFKLGYERVNDFNFNARSNLNNFFGQFLVAYRFSPL